MITNNDIKYFKKARSVAELSDYNKAHIGCIAVYKGMVVGLGYNKNKTHPMQRKYNKYREDSEVLLPKLHAEISCINQIKNLDINFSKVKLYIYRICKNRPHGLSRPCPSCIAAIKDLGIRHIHYTTDDGYSYEYVLKYSMGGVV